MYHAINIPDPSKPFTNVQISSPSLAEQNYAGVCSAR